ncbi:4a-hydroxytetrahydrobiopterin dehydratase [Perlucidibaca piscinae]|uniref:4a-hydroxytetrahydrobiopterin dehydratase n=1 Tax=Perlucidibaca piscinae TaxID=392589 RepID=UPI0003B7A4A9|nr:4a-hydroxytetrahydrobiopterin dehydratase [Perlucidibaca piscinae]
MNCSVRLARWWQQRDNALVAEVLLPDFAAVQAVITELMALAVAMDHHPYVSFGYRRLSVTWQTHDVGGLSDLDWQAALATDTVLARFHAVGENA